MRQQRYSSDPARQARIDYENELEQMLEKHEAELARRPVRPIEAIRISRDFGKTWTLVAICDECRAGIEPPVQRRREGTAGVRYCDWCGRGMRFLRERNKTDFGRRRLIMDALDEREKEIIKEAWRKLKEAQDQLRHAIDVSQNIPALDKFASIYEAIGKQTGRLNKLLNEK